MNKLFSLPVKISALMLSIMVWFYNDVLFIKGFIFIKKWELTLISHFVDNDNIRMAQAAFESAYANPEQISLFAVSAISNLINLYVLWPLMLVCIGLVVFHVNGFLSGFKHIKENMNSVHKAKWMIPQIIAIILLVMLCLMLIILPSFAEIFIVIAIIITVTARFLSGAMGSAPELSP